MLHLEGLRKCEVDIDANSDIKQEINVLCQLNIGTLKHKYLEFYGVKSPKRLSRQFLMQAIAYKMQENTVGGMSQAHERKLSSLVQKFEKGEDISLSSRPQYKPGTRLIREWQGVSHSVIILEKGFEYEGTQYHSLSAIAREITGARWSGPRFFGVDK